MNDREVTCVYCGAKIIDRSTNHTRKYCSNYCMQAQWRRNHGVGVNPKTPSCIHNREVQCVDHKCGRCGWNPKVEQKRKEAMGYG